MKVRGLDRSRQVDVKTAVRKLATVVAVCCSLPHAASAVTTQHPDTVKVELYEWKVELEPSTVRPGQVRFAIANHGAIPHAFEIEGHGLEKRTLQIPPGGKGALDVALTPGAFEAYCPIGNGSHKMLGMQSRLVVASAPKAPAGKPAAEEHSMHAMNDEDGEPAATPQAPKTMRVTGGGAVIHILPGPFPFADSAEAVITERPTDQKADLAKKAHLGPYSNNVVTASGTISITATDRGASNDSVNGIAEFTTEDGVRWKLVMDRVQTRDIPFNPRFGGVIMGLYYHGASGVHTPLVPTIQSSLALWAFGHLYRNDALVTDDAMVHVMLLSRTRHEGDWALACWDCSRNPVEELQLQITPPPGGAPFDAPGGVLFLNWEKSSGENVAMR